MKHWWSAVVKDYLTFSKTERSGIIILIMVAAAALYFVPKLFHPPETTINRTALIKQIAALKITVDSSNPYRSYSRENSDNFDYQQPKNSFSSDVKGELFVFDPNTLEPKGWKRLGVKDKTIQTIQNFLSKGYTFKQPSDIGRIYGLKQDQVERLLPYVRIQNTTREVVSDVKPVYTNTFETRKKVAEVIDINQADSATLISLPGIGSKLAARIINFRNRLGGFVTVAQIGETYGLPDSTFQLIKKQLQCNANAVVTLSINSSDAKQLKVHPYMTWNIANAIVRYREQHGNYASIADLQKIEIITPDFFSKISPYLTL